MKKTLILLILSLFVLPLHAFASENTIPSGMQVQELEDTVDKIMEKYIGKEIPGAAVTIVKDGEFVLLKGYGEADIEKKTPVDPKKTIFEAGSVSKVYTWSAVMQLVEQGKLDLEKDIREYLPKDFLKLEFDDKITMLHLMNHTAGFEDKAENLMAYAPEKKLPLKESLTNEQQPKQVFKPGTVISYSNYSTSLAGYIIERISGKPYSEHMQEAVLGKLNMNYSTFEQEYDHLTNIFDNKSKGYIKLENNYEETKRVYIDGPAGSLNTTAQDMGYFMMAHLDKNQNGKYPLFNKKETLATMHTQTYTINPDLSGVAHGFWEGFTGKHRLIEHGGNTVGFTAQLSLSPEENFGFSVLTNVANEATGMRTDLMEALFGEEKVPLEVSKSENDEIVQGTYRMARGIYSNFLSFLPIQDNADVVISKNDQGGILVELPGEDKPIQYTEISPFVYERVSDKKTTFDKLGFDVNRMAFEVDKDQNVRKMSFGVISDFIPVKWMDLATTNLILISICLITFVLYTLFFVINFIRRSIKARKNSIRELSKGYKATAFLASIGTIVTINIIILFARFMKDYFQSLVPLRIHLYINWLLPLTTVICMILIVKNLKQVNVFSKILQLLLVVLSIVFTIILFNFHFLF